MIIGLPLTHNAGKDSRQESAKNATASVVPIYINSNNIIVATDNNIITNNIHPYSVSP